MTDEHVIRTFFAVPITGKAYELLAASCADYGKLPGWHWMPAENWHLTLYFTGHRTQLQIENLMDAANQVFFNLATTACELTHVGAFPFSHATSKLLAGEALPTKELRTLQQQLSQAIAPLSEYQDERPWRPHVTLARASHPAKSPIAKKLSIMLPVTEVQLYASVRDHTGSRYQTLKTWRLDRQE